MAALHESKTAVAPPRPMLQETNALIDWILERFHVPLRDELAKLEALMAQVDAAHGGDADLPAGLAKLLARIALNLDTHLQREEQVLFAMMQGGGHPLIIHPTTMMRMEHDDHHLRRDERRLLMHDFTLPPAVCPTWKALYAGLARLVVEALEHLRVENDVRFPRFR